MITNITGTAFAPALAAAISTEPTKH